MNAIHRSPLRILQFVHLNFHPGHYVPPTWSHITSTVKLDCIALLVSSDLHAKDDPRSASEMTPELLAVSYDY